MRWGTLGVVRVPRVEELLIRGFEDVLSSLTAIYRRQERGSFPSEPLYVVTLDPILGRPVGEAGLECPNRPAE